MLQPATKKPLVAPASRRCDKKKSLKVNYDPKRGVRCLLFSNVPNAESDEDKLGVIIDYDKDGNVVGMEILSASKQVDNPQAEDYAMM